MPLRWLVGDFETASACDLKKAGAWRYAEDPTTEIIVFSYQPMGEAKFRWRPGVDDAGQLMGYADDPDITFIAHNAAFEKAIWRNIMVPVFGFPDIPNSRWHDTQAVCAMKGLPQALEDVGPLLGLHAQKDMDGRKITLGFSKTDKKTGSLARTDEKLERSYAYCDLDVAEELELHNRIRWLPPGERSVWLLNQRINERGVRLDLDYIRSCQRIVDLASDPLLREFQTITGLAKLGSPKLIDWCEAKGVHLPNLQKETLVEVLGENIDGDEDEYDDADSPAPSALPADVRRALRIRQLIGSASIKKLARMEACVCADGRARGLLQYHGTGPGRSAGRLLQPQNFPRGTIKVDGEAPSVDLVVEAIMTGDHEYVEMLIGPAVETVVSGLRHSIIADSDRVLLSGDFAGIQARTVLAVAGQHDKCAIMAAGQDIYCDMGSQIHKRPITKKDKAERQDGKNSVLGLGFQMGAPKFHVKYCKAQPIEFAENVVHVYRKEWAPKVPFLWYGLQDVAIDTVWDKTPHQAYGVEYRLEDIWLTARLPSGRKMWYANPRPVRRAMPWDETDVRRGFTYEAQKKGVWKTINAFGGQLTENVVMGIERDIMTNAMFKLEKNGFPICLEVHDEIVSEPLAADADEKAFQQIMQDVPGWVKHIGIPIAVETWQGDRYRK